MKDPVESPHSIRPRGMVDCRRARHYVLQDLFIGLKCFSRTGLGTNQERLYSAGLEDLSGTLESSHRDLTISRITEPVGFHDEMDVSVAGGDGNITTGERRYGADDYGSVICEVRCTGQDIVHSASLSSGIPLGAFDEDITRR